MASILPILHILQAGLSGYSLHESYTAIQSLRQYEDVSKKGARYSGHVEHELHKTRTTMTSSALTILLSLFSASTLLLISSDRNALRIALAGANVATTYFARMHVAKFWEGKSKIPLVDGFNKGIESSNAVKERLGWLGVGWAILGIGELARAILG